MSLGYLSTDLGAQCTKRKKKCRHPFWTCKSPRPSPCNTNAYIAYAPYTCCPRRPSFDGQNELKGGTSPQSSAQQFKVLRARCHCHCQSVSGSQGNRTKNQNQSQTKPSSSSIARSSISSSALLLSNSRAVHNHDDDNQISDLSKKLQVFAAVRLFCLHFEAISSVWGTKSVRHRSNWNYIADWSRYRERVTWHFDVIG